MAGNVHEFNDDNFDGEVLKADEPVLVDFWAPWCAPCRAIAPMIAELAEENLGSIKIGKVNIDDAPKTSGTYSVNNVPTLMVFKNGEVKERFIGGRPKANLQEVLDAAKG